LTISNDIIMGARAIADFLFPDDPGALRLVYRLVSEVPPEDQLPVFRLGTRLAARKSTLLQWIAKREEQPWITARERRLLRHSAPPQPNKYRRHQYR
jgi:hypothetical protein